MALTYKNIQDLIVNVIDVDDSSTLADIKTYINMAAKEIWHRYPWQERRTRAFVNTFPTYSTGTVSISKDSATLTGVSTLWTTNSITNAYKFAVEEDKPWFDITSVGGEGTITLTENWPFTALSGSSYVIYSDIVTLATDVEKVTKVWIHTDDYSVELRQSSEAELDSYDHFPNRSDEPSAYAFVPKAGDTQPRLRFDVAPDEVYRIEYEYLKSYSDMTADGDDCDVPESRRDLIFTRALSFAYERDHTAKARVKRGEFEQDVIRAWMMEGGNQDGRVGGLSDRRGPSRLHYPFKDNVTYN